MMISFNPDRAKFRANITPAMEQNIKTNIRLRCSIDIRYTTFAMGLGPMIINRASEDMFHHTEKYPR